MQEEDAWTPLPMDTEGGVWPRRRMVRRVLRALPPASRTLDRAKVVEVVLLRKSSSPASYANASTLRSRVATVLMVWGRVEEHAAYIGHTPSADEQKAALEGEDIPSPPPHLVCGLTMDVMSDPVITPSGNTYERAAVERWIALKGVDPVTRRPLRGSDLYPNRNIREAAESWRAEINMYRDVVRDACSLDVLTRERSARASTCT
jgi:hypothetical protein